MATRPATYGFWRGFLAGLVLAAAGALALAWLYPPRPSLPPEVDTGTLPAPGLPAGTAEPEPPHAAADPAAAPPIAGLAAPDPAPDPAPEAPAPKPAP